MQGPDDIVPTKRALNAPKEIMRLINWMMTNPPDIVSFGLPFLTPRVDVSVFSGCLFRETSRREIVYCYSGGLSCADITNCAEYFYQKCLDTGDEFPSTTTECDVPVAVVATLVAFLDSLVQPVVPPSLHAKCLQVRDTEAAFEVCLCLVLINRAANGSSPSYWASSLASPSMYVFKFRWCESAADVPCGGMDIIDGMPPLHLPTRKWK